MSDISREVSIFPAHICCLLFPFRTPLSKRTYFRRIPESAKKVKTFEYIINNTNQYAVGPLDFDGIGYIYHCKYVVSFYCYCWCTSDGQHFPSRRLVCRTDPLVPRYIAMRHAVHLREDPEKRKKAQKALQLKELQDPKADKDAFKALKKKKRKVSTYHVATPQPKEAADCPAKRRRVCTDMKIAAGAGVQGQDRPRRLRSAVV